MDDLIAIAKIAKPKGLNGEVTADVLTHFPDRFEGLKNVTAVLPTGETKGLNIERFSFQNARLVLKFEGLDSIDSVEPLRNAEICVTEGEAVELKSDEYFDWQLEGCSVETVRGETIGKVRELMRTGGTEILLVDADHREYLIPFAESICVDVDVDKKLILIDPPEGLLEF